jgi:uncharacterized protein with PQ loop repeat
MDPHTQFILKQVFGYIALVAWSIQLVPQVWHSYRNKTTQGLSPYMLLIWLSGATVFIPYSIHVQLAFPLILQACLFVFFALVSLCQCLYYGNNWSRRVVLGTFLFGFVGIAGFDTGMVFMLDAATTTWNAEWLVTVCGIIPLVMSIVGFLPGYWHLYKTQDVSGISLLFLCVDLLGASTSFVSLVFHETIDWLAGGLYLACTVLDIGMVAIYLHLRRLKPKSEEKAEEGEFVPINL